jgi:hypothetical protein
MEWRHISLPIKKKFKQAIATREIMWTVILGSKRILLMEFLLQGSTINAGVYCKTPKKLRRAIQNKRRGMLSRGVVMLHDNASPHTVAAMQDLIATVGWEQFDHAPYSPDLAPSDLHVFLHLKLFLVASSSTATTRSKKPLTCCLHRRQHHFTMQDYKNWCPAMTSASTMVETMSKSSVQYVHQMAI